MYFTAIPLPGPRTIDRQSDRYSSGSSLNQQYTSYTTNTIESGYTGIYNPANSCFMNAALQCLSNTRELRDYFLGRRSFLFREFYSNLQIESRHLTEINRTNPLGMKGAMAEEFGHVIKSLWNRQSSFTYANLLRVRTNFFH